MTDSYTIFDIALPPSPDGPTAEELYMAFPDLDEVFSAEELLAFWGEVEEGASSGAEAGSSSGAGPSPP